MLAALSMTSFAGGTLVSCCAARMAGQRERYELLGGLLLVGGLVLVGMGLPLFR